MLDKLFKPTILKLKLSLVISLCCSAYDWYVLFHNIITTGHSFNSQADVFIVASGIPVSSIAVMLIWQWKLYADRVRIIENNKEV